MFERIVVAVDGSECAERAAAVGVSLAAAYGAEVDAVSAVRARDDGVFHDDEERSGARSAVESVVERARDRGLTAEGHVVEGPASRALVEFAESNDADLVVMCREGRSGFAEHLLGSTTERVLRDTDLPILVVPFVEGTLPGAYDRVLVTTDGSEAAEAAGPTAVDVAERLGARLDVLSVVDVQSAAGVFDAGGVSDEYVDRLERQAREATERIATDADVEVHRATVRGTPHEGIRDYVAENDVDLVVMASTGQTGLTGQHLGSVAGRVLRVVDVPVLVVDA